MMRCIGINKKQIVRFMRLEALNQYKTAVLIGLALGMSAPWILCGVLRYAVGEKSSNIPFSGISVIGIVSGIIAGVVTVLLAARSPVNQVTEISPATAVSGNSEHGKMKDHTFHVRFIKIETALDTHHTTSVKENLLLMIGSSTLSIIPFSSSAVLIDFVNHLMPQLTATSDIDISSSDGLNLIDNALTETLRGMSGVKQVYGCRSNFGIPAEKDTGIMISSIVDLVPFDDFDLDCLKKDGALRQGSNLSKAYGDSNYALAAWDRDSLWKIDNKILIGDEETKIAGLLKYDSFSNNGLTNGKITLITPDQTFTRLTDITGYSLIMVQTISQATDEGASQLCNTAAESGNRFNDKRDQYTSGAYLASVFRTYYFSGIITLVMILNIMNSISTSISIKIKQYGAMRAVGVDEQQITKMTFTEASTYALWGGGTGCATGLPLGKMLYDFLISDHLPYAVWNLLVHSLVIILLFAAFAVTLAAYASAKRVWNTSVTETINEL